MINGLAGTIGITGSRGFRVNRLNRKTGPTFFKGDSNK